MGWDEALFSFALRTAESLSLRKKPTSKDLGKVLLSGVTSRLNLLACALTGEAIQIHEAEAQGGHRGHRFFMPEQMDLFGDPILNMQAWIYRVAYMHASRSLGFMLPSDELDTSQRVLLTLLAHPATVARLEDELPESARLKELLHSQLLLQKSTMLTEDSLLHQILSGNRTGRIPELRRIRNSKDLWAGAANFPGWKYETLAQPDTLKLWGLLMSPPPSKSSEALKKSETFSTQSLSTGTEKKAKPRESVTEVKSCDKEDENPLVHVFEKVQTAEEFKGGNKATDGSDELEEQIDAIEELNLKHVIRSRDRASSVYRSDAMMDGGAPDLQDSEDEPRTDGSVHHYDEWNHRTHSYRRNWCTVIESTASDHLNLRDPESGTDSGQYVRDALAQNAREIRDLKAQLTRILTERSWRNRQSDGPEIDLDAMVDRHATLLSGNSPSDKLYCLRRRRERDLATYILLDGSLSTDSWISGHRVMDIARHSVLMLGEVLSGIHDSVAIGSFHSNTRRDCRFIQIKGFKEPWKSVQRRIASIEPAGYTRIGPALRHATRILAATPARRKLLLLISDGKPTDYDHYEGSYGIADVKQAIREATGSSIRVRALAIDSQAKFYLPQMFGNGNYQILPDPKQLAGSLARIYTEALR